MTFENPLTEAWRIGRATFGIWCMIPSSISTEMTAGLGFDYVCIDLQHGGIGYSDAVPMLQAARAAGVAAVARVQYNDPGEIMKMLDAGALGVIVPLVNNAEEAARAVDACRYPPVGNRSFGPLRASLVTGSRDPADLDQVVCLVMIETAEGLANVEAIASTPGLDGIYVGPSDLSLALGLAPGYERPEREHIEAIESIRAACERHGIISGIQCGGGDTAARRRAQGFQMVTVGTDASFLTTHAGRELAAARAGQGS
jgi:4-hydroxy-2-oxoheptanedioate aldolase